MDPKLKLIKTPVRGNECLHADLFDLEEFANHSIDLHKDDCFSCNKRCKTLKIDKKIEE